MNISDNNLMLNCVDTIKEACLSYFEKSFIDYVEYTRLYFDGHVITLNSKSPEILRSYVELDTFLTLEEIKTYPSTYAYADENFHKTTYFKNNQKNWKQFGEICEKFNTRHRFYIIDMHKEFSEILGFSTASRKLSHIQVYLEILPQLKDFFNYFRDSAEDLIVDCKKDRIKLTKRFFRKTSLSNQFNQKKASFIQVDQYNPKLTISEREKDCLSLIACGYTMKTAAKQLNISPRTVEVHLRNIKEKFNVHTKDQLIEIWHTFISSFNQKD